MPDGVAKAPARASDGDEHLPVRRKLRWIVVRRIDRHVRIGDGAGEVEGGRRPLPLRLAQRQTHGRQMADGVAVGVRIVQREEELAAGGADQVRRVDAARAERGRDAAHRRFVDNRGGSGIDNDDVFRNGAAAVVLRQHQHETGIIVDRSEVHHDRALALRGDPWRRGDDDRLVPLAAPQDEIVVNCERCHPGAVRCNQRAGLPRQNLAVRHRERADRPARHHVADRDAVLRHPGDRARRGINPEAAGVVRRRVEPAVVQERRDDAVFRQRLPSEGCADLRDEEVRRRNAVRAGELAPECREQPRRALRQAVLLVRFRAVGDALQLITPHRCERRFLGGSGCVGLFLRLGPRFLGEPLLLLRLETIAVGLLAIELGQLASPQGEFRLDSRRLALDIRLGGSSFGILTRQVSRRGCLPRSRPRRRSPPPPAGSHDMPASRRTLSAA